MSKQTERVKKHFSDNQKLYIGVGIGIVVTAVAVVVCRSTQIAVNNPALVNWKPTSNVVQVQMVRPGPKAFVVQCLEDQTTWPSMRAAAEGLNVNRSDLIKHLKGLVPDVDGLHFEKLAEI